MAEDLPKAFGALDCGCRARAFEDLARNESVIGVVDRHGYELSDFTHRDFLSRFLKRYIGG
jgi:hypothetical protein